MIYREWGGQFERNKTLIKNLVQSFPDSVRESVMQARLPDGTLWFNHPDVMRGFLSIELARNPAGITVMSGPGDIAKSMVDRYKEIQETRTQNRAKYNKDEAMQLEERKIISALMQHGLMDKNGKLKEAA